MILAGSARTNATYAPASALLACLCCMLCALAYSAPIACRTGNGDVVDWWSAIKAPGSGDEGSGAYAYLDALSRFAGLAQQGSGFDCKNNRSNIGSGLKHQASILEELKGLDIEVGEQGQVRIAGRWERLSSSFLYFSKERLRDSALLRTLSLLDRPGVWTQLEGLDKTFDNPLAATLQPLYQSTDTGAATGCVMYNDEPASSYCSDCASFSLAHAKGWPKRF